MYLEKNKFETFNENIFEKPIEEDKFARFNFDYNQLNCDCQMT